MADVRIRTGREPSPVVASLSDARDASRFGSKAANLSSLAGVGFHVPPGFCVSASAYFDHLDSHGLFGFIRARSMELEGRTPGAEATPPSEAALSEIREAIIRAPHDRDLEIRIRQEIEALGEDLLAVRSSALSEDSTAHSFAGQHGTYFVDSPERCLLAIKHCWASLWSDRAFSYREYNGLRHLDQGMAVLVQLLLPAEAAGVAFTLEPISSDNAVIIEACVGIGEALVSGKVRPDRWVVSRVDLRVLSKSMSKKETAVIANGKGAVEQIDLGPAAAKEPAIDDATAVEIARTALDAERHLGFPADVEWGIADGTVWLLQARPITATFSSGAAPLEDSIVWSNVNTGEVLPDVVTPMTWSVLRGFVQEMLCGMFGHLGVDFGEHEVVRLVGGRAYFNVSILATAFRQVPGLGSMEIGDLLGGHQEHDSRMTSLLARDVPGVRAGRLRLLVRLPSILAWLARHSPNKADAFCARWLVLADQAAESLGKGASEQELVERAAALVHGLSSMADGLGFAAVAMGEYSTLRYLSARWAGDDDGSLVNRLLAHQGGLASAEAGLALARLADLAQGSEAVASALYLHEPWPATKARLEATSATDSAVASFMSAWEEFLRDYGHHSRGELEMGNPRWAESPEYVMETVRRLASRPSQTHSATHAEPNEDALLADLGWLKSRIFATRLARTRAGAAARENVKNAGVRHIAVLRWTLLEIGEHLVRREILARPDDVFFLKWEELEGVRGGEAPFDVRRTITERRERHRRFESRHAAPVVIDDEDSGWFLPHDDLERTRTWTGLAVSPGVVRGRARVIQSVREDAEVLEGEILVAPYTDPGWTPYFLRAAAIVMDMGGLLSHGSIIAREYGIPAVANVGPASKIIQNGQLLEVDGNKGTVLLLQREGDGILAPEGYEGG